MDERGARAAPSLMRALPVHAELVTSPARRCTETAATVGRPFARVAALRECDFGCWAGKTLAGIAEADPAASRAWMTDPDAAPHGGESLNDFATRVGAWLDSQAGQDGTVVAITHAGVVRAALVRALGAPLDAFWRLDIAPLSISELHAHDGRWTVTRVNHAVVAG